MRPGIKTLAEALFIFSVSLLLAACSSTRSTPVSRKPSSTPAPRTETIRATVEENPHFRDFPDISPEYRFSLRRSIALECTPGDFEVFEYLIVSDEDSLPEDIHNGMNVTIEMQTRNLTCPEISAQGPDNAIASKAKITGE